MAWESNYSNFGVVKVENDRVKVYKDNYNYKTVSVGKTVVKADWAGGELNVYLSDGRVRRYSDQYNYKTI